jgi:hypothetical protein
LTVSAAVILTFAGFRSRCTTPFSCAASIALGDLQREPQRVVERQRTALQAIRECFALDELHDEEMAAAGFLHAVESRDAGMIERSERPGFALEPGDTIGVGREGVRQNLDRNIASKLCVAGAADLAHAARAKERHDLIRAEPDAGSEGHRGCEIIWRDCCSRQSSGVSHQSEVASPQSQSPVLSLSRESSAGSCLTGRG